jgi:hypothetical protein
MSSQLNVVPAHLTPSRRTPTAQVENLGRPAAGNFFIWKHCAGVLHYLLA